MPTFIGREAELRTVGELLKKKSASLVVIRGRRRIGKSRLVEELARRYPFDAFYRFAGLPPTTYTTEQSQRDVFAGQLATQIGSGYELTSEDMLDWSRLFNRLSQRTASGRTLVLLDEISWMGSRDSDFIGKLKDAWDVHFKKNDQLLLVICGSVSTWIERNILSSTGYVGRISLDLTLRELPLSDCAKFLGPQALQTSAYEKLKMLAVTGGVPLYLEHVRPDLSAEQNITMLCFQRSGLLFREFDNIFSDLFSKRSALYKKMIEALGEGPLTQDEISTAIGYERSSTIGEYLDDLITSGFIVRDRSRHLTTGRPTKLSRYRISDCYTRFYLKYIEPNRHKIEQDQFERASISSFAHWNSQIGLQFEALVLNNRKALWQAVKLNPEEIIFDNPYFQAKTKRRAGCQIDYLVQTKHNTVYVFEIKFSQREIRTGIIDEVKDKIDRLALPKHVSYRPVLIHVNGVADEVEDQGYFASIIDFGAVFFAENP